MICKYCGRENLETESLKSAYLYRLDPINGGLFEIQVYIDEYCPEGIHFGRAKAISKDHPDTATYVSRKSGQINGKWETANVWFYRRSRSKAASLLMDEISDKLNQKLQERQWLNMDIAGLEKQIDKLQIELGVNETNKEV